MFHVKHLMLLYGNMPMQQESRPLRIAERLSLLFAYA